MEARMPFRADRMQDLALGLSGRPRQALPSKSELGLGCERFYLTPPRLLRAQELPAGWGLLEYGKRRINIVRLSERKLRTQIGFRHEMNLLLASLRRVEIRVEPQTITEFLKWKNRMQ